MSIVLQQEYDFFLAHLQKFSKKHLNEFVVIKEDQVIGFFQSYEKALVEGLAKFGATTPFFIEEVTKEEKVVHFFHGVK